MSGTQKILGDNCSQLSIGSINIQCSSSGQQKLWRIIRNFFIRSDISCLPITATDQLSLSHADDLLLRSVIERERKYQDNTVKIVQHAANRLADESIDEHVPDPEPEWVSLFYEYCKTSPTEQMQRLWGAILAQKIRSPQTGKPLTLHCLRMLTYSSATLFDSLCKMAVRTQDKVFVLRDLVEHYEYGDLLELENVGLINADRSIGFYTRNWWDRYPQIGNKTIELVHFEKDSPLIKAIPFTAAGIELYYLVSQSVDDEYLERSIAIFASHNVLKSRDHRAGSNGSNTGAE